MKKLILSLLAASFLISCEESKKEINFEPCAIVDTLVSSNELTEEVNRMRSSRTLLEQPRVTTLVMFDVDTWFPKYNSLEALKTRFTPMLEDIRQRDLQDGVITEWKFALSKPGEFKGLVLVDQCERALRSKYKTVEADNLLLMKLDRTIQGAAVLGGCGYQGANFAVVFTTDVNTVGSYTEQVIRHEVCGHSQGLPHTHSYVHTINGISGQAIDNYGQKIATGVPAIIKGEPKFPVPGTCMSYAVLAKAPFTVEFDTIHKEMRLAFLLSEPVKKRLGSWRTETEYSGFVITPYTSGTQGLRHYSGTTDLSKYDEIRVYGDMTGFLYSFGRENTSLSGALAVPSNGIIKIDKTKGLINYFNFRHKTSDKKVGRVVAVKN